MLLIKSLYSDKRANSKPAETKGICRNFGLVKLSSFTAQNDRRGII